VLALVLLHVISEIEKKSKTKKWRIKISCKKVFINGEKKEKKTFFHLFKMSKN